MRTVVVTGAGLAVPGMVGIQDLVPPGPARSGGFDPDIALCGRRMRHKDRASRFALGAVEPSLRDAGLCDGAALAGAATVVSTNFGNLDSVCSFAATIRSGSVVDLSPVGLPHTSSNCTAGWVAIEFGLSGPSLTVCNGATGGLDALFWAGNLIGAGRAEVAVVVGVEPHTDAVAALHAIDGAESWLDGAVAVVLESAEHAQDRGRRARAELAGYWRAAEVSEVLRPARAALAEPIGRYLADQQTGLADADDLTARLGRCSGALGVLQCAAAVAWLDRGNTTPVLAVSGGTSGEQADGEAVAALLLTPGGQSAERAA